MKIRIEWQDQAGKWHHYQTMNKENDCFRVASSRANSTKKRHRLVDSIGNLIDLVEPKI